MRLSIYSGILTLVLVVKASPAALPTSLNLDESKPSSTADSISTQKESTTKLEDVDVATPPPEAEKKLSKPGAEYFYKYQETMGPRLGALFDTDYTTQKISNYYLVGFYYMLPSLSPKHFEVGVDLQTNGTGRTNGFYKYIFYSTESFRPFVKGGLSMLIQPDKGLANAIDYRQYSLRGGVGLEDTLKDRVSVRWDLEFQVGVTNYLIALVFGYSWGF